MKPKMTTIRFNEEEQGMIDLYMHFQNKSLSSVVKEVLLEDVNDFFESILSEEAMMFNEVFGEKYTTAQLLKTLDLEN